MAQSDDRHHRVTVEPMDALADVLARVRNHGGRPVFLTIPAESPLFLTVSEYRALREAVRTNGINLVVVSDDLQRRDYAGLFNLVAVEDDATAIEFIDSQLTERRPSRPPIDPALGPPRRRTAGPWAGQTGWNDQRAPVAAPTSPPPSPPPVPVAETTQRALVPVIEPAPLPEPPPPRRRRRWPWLAAALIALAVILAAAAVLPQATVTITRARTPLTTDVIFAVLEPGATAPPDAAFTIDGVRRSATITITAAIPATGTLNLPGQPARGGIVFANPGTSSVTLPAGAEIVSDGGLVFTLDEEVAIPAAAGSIAGNAAGSVTAVAGGAAGNLRQGALSGRHELGVYFSNREGALTGGTDRTVTVVSEADIAGAAEFLAKHLHLAMGEALTESTGQPTAVVPGSIEHPPLAPTIDAEAGAQVALFTATATTEASGLTFDLEAAFAQTIEAARAGLALPSGTDLDISSAFIDLTQVIEGDETGRLTLVRVTIDQVIELDEAALEALPDELARMRVNAARQTVEAIEGVESATIEIKPAWLPELARERMPILPQRIQVEIR